MIAINMMPTDDVEAARKEGRRRLSRESQSRTRAKRRAERAAALARNPPPPRPTRVCQEAECGRVHLAKGLCDRHYAAANGYKLRCREWYQSAKAKDPDYAFKGHLRHRYGLTIGDYELILSRQGGACAICGGEDPNHRTHRRFLVDHDHLTGKVRGLLCHPCNVGIGNFRDDPDRLTKAADYLNAQRGG